MQPEKNSFLGRTRDAHFPAAVITRNFAGLEVIFFSEEIMYAPYPRANNALHIEWKPPSFFLNAARLCSRAAERYELVQAYHPKISSATNVPCNSNSNVIYFGYHADRHEQWKRVT